MTLHFAYGSNMSRALMAARCTGASLIGNATLSGWRFVIITDGYASIVPHPGARVHGVVWRLGPRDVAAINAYENLDSGLYRRRTLTVRCGDRSTPALVYVARSRQASRPRPGYMELVIAAARDCNLPAGYIADLGRWAPTRWQGARAVEVGELG
jgi:gamma-glutamylcyclotransferase (GGCT)/AIG2-like uncharacterized protein YtfP